MIGIGTAECADRAEASEAVSSRVLVWHVSSFERGRQNEGTTASSADLKCLFNCYGVYVFRVVGLYGCEFVSL